MIWLMIVIAAVLGAAWRRILGGWLNLRRTHIVAVGLLFSAPAWVAWGSAETWFSVPIGGLEIPLPIWLKALILTGLIPLHFTPAVRFTNPWSTSLRYTVFGPLPLAILTGFWPALAVGPICGGTYALADKYQWPPFRPGFINDWSNYGEFVVGAASMAAFTAAPFFAAW